METTTLGSDILHFLFIVTSFSVGIFVLQTLWTVTYNLFFHPLRHYPGPKSWGASVIPLVWSQVQGHDIYDVLELHKKYGGVVRTAPDELSYADPVVYKDAFAHKQSRKEFGKSHTFTVVPPNGVNGILFANREDHSRYRRAFASSFSERGMQTQQPLIKGYVDLLINGLKERSVDGAQDMTQWFNWTSFDVIGNLTFGESFGCLENQRMHPWIAAIFANTKSTANIRAIRRLGFVHLIPYLAPKKILEGRMQMFKFNEGKMKERISMGSERGDFMDPVIEKSEKGEGLNFAEMVSNGSNLILAGSETTATLLSGAVYQLCKNPEAMKRITEEIRSSFSSVEEMDLFSTARLKYTLAVLDETMRIYPPVPNQPSRASPPEGETIDGKVVPPGTTVYVSQYIFCHLEKYWTKPNEFHPERFLKGTPEAEPFKDDNHEVFQPFSVGSRNCIGRNLAYAEMRLVLTRVLWAFDLELDPRSENWGDGQRAYALWEKPPLWMKIKPRAEKA